jgi:hypothetical protein
MSKIGELKVRFLSFSSLQTSRSGFLPAKNALFTLPSLLFVADSGTRQGAIAFFSSLYAFCHLADLFSFFLPSFSHQARVVRPRQSLSTDFNASPAALQQRPRLAPRSAEEPSALKRKVSSFDGDSGGCSQASTRPLPSSQRRRSGLFFLAITSETSASN